MSSSSLPPPRGVKQGSRVAIVSARFNEIYTNALVEHCIDELERLDPHCAIEVQQVPGSFEIPLAVNCLLEAKPEIEAVIAIGVLLEGETSHALLVAQNVTSTLQEVALSQQRPVIHQVLLLVDEEQAQARCFGDEINRGTEAARAAISMIEDLARIARQAEATARGDKTGSRTT